MTNSKSYLDQNIQFVPVCSVKGFAANYLCFCFLLSFCDFFLALLQTMYVMPVLLILKQARSTRMKPRRRMATMAPMIAPKGTCVSWKGGKVEYSPVPVD